MMAVSRLHIEEWTDNMYMYVQHAGCIRNELHPIALKRPTLVQLSAVSSFSGIKSVDACRNSLHLQTKVKQQQCNTYILPSVIPCAALN